jgi:hypothetical protein
MRTAMLAAVLLALAACGADVDRAAWQRELEAQGVEIADWAAYQDVWLDACEDEDSFGYFVTMSGASGSVTRTNVRYACPDRMDEAEDALGG